MQLAGPADAELLIDRGRALAAAGDLRGAWRSFSEAERTARAAGRAALAELAMANGFSVGVELRVPRPTPAAVRAELLGSRDPLIRYLGASALTRHYQILGSPGKALFYARITQAVAPPERRGHANHQLGVTLLARSDARAALPLLRRGIHTCPASTAPPAVSLSALAYCLALLGRRPQARGHAGEADALQQREPSGLYGAAIHLNLGYTALELGEPDRAALHAEQALGRLPLTPSHDHKAALYLAGESAFQLGWADEADIRFRQLGGAYFAESPDVADLLAVLRTAPLVNWLA